MRSTSTSSHADDRPPPGRLVVVVVGTLVGGICFGALVDRALWATEQANKPQAIVSCPAVSCPACPACPAPTVAQAVAPPCPACPAVAAPTSPPPSAPSAPPCPASPACPAVDVCPGCPACPVACPEKGAPLPLAGTLWTVSSAGWDGYLDFRGDGVYWTHWGFGKWQLRDDVLTMQNDYDGFGFELRVRDGALSGRRSDGSTFSGTFVSRYGARR